MTTRAPGVTRPGLIAAPTAARPGIGGIQTKSQNEREQGQRWATGATPGGGLDQVREWARTSARAADAKGGDDTVILEVGAVLAITDAFVITSGRNARQVRTIAEEVEARVKAAGGPSPLRIEGRDQAEWLLIDYGDWVVHVFAEETRRYFELERLWADAPRLSWGEPAPASASVD